MFFGLLDPGSGSSSTRYGFGSGSGSCYNQAKTIKKPTVLLLLYGFFSLKIDLNVTSKSNKQKNLGKKIIFGCNLEGH